MEDQNVPVVAEEEMNLPAGARLGKYKVIRLLGAGGMGAVYEAVHTEIGRRVAVKTLAPGVAAIPGARQRFLREAQLTSRLRHPHIVDLTDMGSEGRVAYLVMELLAGEDLAHRLERTGPMAPRDLVDLMLPVCSALIEAHAAGIVHRDLKPQNIFLATSHHGVEPKVLDFGISKSSDSDVSALTGTGSVIGTPHYLAPEQIKDARSASASSDQYSIGVIFYKCLTNKNPFEGESLFAVLHAIVTETPVPLRARRPDLPEGLERVVERAMNPLPWERFASARGLGRALLPYASAKARTIWEEIFTAADPADARPKPELRRDSHTMPMPTPDRPMRFASGASPVKAERVDSGTLSPAVTSSPSVDLSALAVPRRGHMILWTLLCAALAGGAFVVFSRGSRAPEVPPSAAAPPPVAPVAAPPPVAPVAEPAAAEQARLRAKRQAALDEASAREAQARAEAAAQAAAAKRDAAAKAAAAKETEARAAANEAEASARRRSATPARHGSHARPEAPAAAPRNLNPNGSPVID